MAIIDADFWEVRRKFGGACGASCRGAPYIRMKPSPCNAPTREQSRTRALWARAHRYWQDVLEEWERQDWRDYVSPRDWYDRLEQYRALTGCGLFVAYASRALLAGFTPEHDPWYILGGWALETMSLELVSSSRVRVTFTTDPYMGHALVLYGRGPLGVGEFPKVKVPSWPREQVPSGWRWIGNGQLEQGSPIEMDLPFVVPAGMKFRAIGGKMSYHGDYPSDWVEAEVVA